MNKFDYEKIYKGVYSFLFSDSETTKNTKINITLLNVKINDSDENVFGIQKYYNKEKIKQIDQILRLNSFIKQELSCKEIQFIDKTKLIYNQHKKYNSLIKCYKTELLNDCLINNLLISETIEENIEPTLIPNIGNYLKSKRIEYKKNNISVILKSYNFDNFQNYFCDISIDKYNNLNSDFYNLDEIIFLIQKILFV